jgi:hypothetical protein
VSETLASTLLVAEPAERERLLRSADRDALAEVLPILGHTREVAAAEVLALVDDVVADRALRKAARRELHRLRSVGLEPPARTAPQAPTAVADHVRTLPVSDAWATDIDSSGGRGLWLVADKPLGGVWFAALLLNDLTGLEELSLVDTTRKRFQSEFDQAQRQAGPWVNLPGEYSMRLVREAVDLTRELGGGLPTRYHAFRDVFGEAPGPPERALIYDTISPVEINFTPGWLDDSPRLLGEPEVAGWYVPVPAELRAQAIEAARAPGAGLLVPGHTPEQQALQLLAEAARLGLTPRVRHALRRRLEETAHMFAASDRLAMARLAAAAARGLDDTAGVPPERHPLVRLLLAAGLARLTGSEMVGTRRASDVLFELIERATQQGAQPGAIETRPSGLILPR